MSTDRDARSARGACVRRLIVLIAAAALASPLAVSAQAKRTEPPELAASPDLAEHAADTLEEVMVYGETPLIQLRTEVYRAEDQYFATFNALNSSDEFDIRCERVATTGTRIPQRQCTARFYDEITARAATAWQRGETISPQHYLSSHQALIDMKSRELREEMETLVLEHPKLREALYEFNAAADRFESEHARRCAGRFLTCRR